MEALAEMDDQKTAEKLQYKPRVETKLSRQDFKRVDDLAKEDGVTKAEINNISMLVRWLITFLVGLVSFTCNLGKLG